jgi:capsular polysaccharide transport system permease protein
MRMEERRRQTLSDFFRIVWVAMVMLLRQWAVQRRVLGAIFMREIQTRWGRRNLGFAWLFAEPLVFALPVLGLWSAMRSPTEHGLPMIALAWSGYMPLLIFRHISNRALRLVRSNAVLLYHRAITPLDIIIGLCALEAVGNIAAMAFSFLLLHLIGVLEIPYNYTLFLVGVMYMTWWSLAVALLIAAWSERNEMVEHIWPPISYMYMPISGFFYLAEWLPPSVRDLALTFIPPLHCYELIRSGLFGPKIQAFYDIGYLTVLLAVLTLVGLRLARDIRRFVELD